MEDLLSPLAFSLILLCVVGPAAEAQWTPQFDPSPRSIGAIAFSVVDTNVVWALMIDGYNVAYGPLNQFIRTTNGGRSWTQGSITAAAAMHPGSISAVDSLTGWVTMQSVSPTLTSDATSEGIFKTSDGGTLWTKDTTAFQGSGGRPMFIHFFDPKKGIVVGERNNNGLSSWEIYTTTNGGTRWDSVPQVNIPPKVAGEQLMEGFEYAATQKTFWFCTSASMGRVFRSTNSGLTWTAAAIGSGYGRVHSIAFQDDSVGLACVFVGGNPTTVKTTDGGSSWSAIAPPSRPTPHIIAHVPGTSGAYVVTGHIWPGTLTGSAYTLDGGRSWTTVDSNPNGPLAFAAPGCGWSAGYDAANVNTIYGWSGIPLVTSVPFYSEKMPREFALSQNYPNPFNPSTMIAYALPHRSRVTLTLFNALGQAVATLVNESKDAGSHEVRFNGSNLSSGVYFYRLQAGAFVEAKKFVLVR